MCTKWRKHKPTYKFKNCSYLCITAQNKHDAAYNKLQENYYLPTFGGGYVSTTSLSVKSVTEKVIDELYWNFWNR